MLVGLALIAVAFAPREEEVVSAVTSDTRPASALAPEIGDGTTAPVPPDGIGTEWGEERLGRRPLAGFGEVQATITSPTGEICEVCLLSATTEEQRRRGLMEVTDLDLGGYDGMLFEYPGEISGAFWMRNTPLALSIAYFDNDGALVSTDDLLPCEDSPDCPSYPASGPFRFALEVLEGDLADLGVTDGATIRVNARTCTAAEGGA